MSFFNASESDSKKQVPIKRTELVKEARLPAPLVIQPRPNYVMINNTGSMHFCILLLVLMEEHQLI